MADYRDDIAAPVEEGALPKSYLCPCGVEHEFGLWVYAHWDILLTHECDSCNRINLIEAGEHVGVQNYALYPSEAKD